MGQGKSVEAERRPRVLGVRPGVNPNSSSLGVDVTFLLLGSAATVAATLVLSAILRARKKPVPVHGDGGAAPK